VHLNKHSVVRQAKRLQAQFDRTCFWLLNQLGAAHWHERVLSVCYEDLAALPRRELKRIYNFARLNAAVTQLDATAGPKSVRQNPAALADKICNFQRDFAALMQSDALQLEVSSERAACPMP